MEKDGQERLYRCCSHAVQASSSNNSSCNPASCTPVDICHVPFVIILHLGANPIMGWIGGVPCMFVKRTAGSSRLHVSGILHNSKAFFIDNLQIFYIALNYSTPICCLTGRLLHLCSRLTGLPSK